MPNFNESVMDEAHRGLQIIIPNKESRKVRFKDLPKVWWHSFKIKIAMLNPFPGRYPKAMALCHCQIERDDPLTFFTVDRQLGWYFGNRLLHIRTIINPKIIWKSKAKYKHREACMSFPNKKPVNIKRHESVLMEYWTFFGRRKKRFYLDRAFVCQHEIDHFNDINIYEIYKKKLSTKKSRRKK